MTSSGAAGTLANLPRGEKVTWVLLSYRMPREPSTPRIAVWRKLERLGAARLGDGLVGLPANERTREQADWIAEEVVQAGGTATVWLATPASVAHERAVVTSLQEARAREYEAVMAEAETAQAATAEQRRRALRHLRGQLRRIARRDFFPTEQRERAQAAVETIGQDPAASHATARPRPSDRTRRPR